MNGNQQLDERLRRLSWPVDHGGVWASIETRAHKQERPSQEPRKSGTRANDGAGLRKRNFASRRGGGLRVAVVASIAMVLVAAVAIGSFMTVRNLARPAFVLAITDDNVVSAGAQSGHWERLPLSSEGGGIYRYAFSIDPTNSSILYTASDTGLFKSTDGARSWRQVSMRTDIHFVTIDPASPSTLYALVSAPGEPLTVNRSDDGGKTWTDLSDSTPAQISGYVLVMWVDATVSPRAVYLVAGSGDVAGISDLWRSIDRGESWANVKPEEADLLWQSAGKQNAWADFQGTLTDADTGTTLEVMVGYIDDGDPVIRYASTEEGIYKTVDAGKTWHKASAGLESWEVWGLVADPSSPSILYATTPTGIFKTADGGVTWRQTLPGAGSIVAAPSSPSTLYAWTTAGLYRSSNGGKSWTPLAGTGLAARDPSRGPSFGLTMVADDDPNTVFAHSGIEMGTLFRSTDGGNTWSEVPRGRLAVADPVDPSIMYAVTASGTSGQQTVAKSTDAGATWTVFSPQVWTDRIAKIVVDPHHPSNIYVVQEPEDAPSAVFRSVDGGLTWENVELGGAAEYIAGLQFDPWSPDTLYVLTYQVVEDVGSPGVYRSKNGGATWENITGELAATAYVSSLVIESAAGGTLLAATPQGLFKWVPQGD